MIACSTLLGLPDLDRIREILKRIQEILAVGGVALAAFGAFCFLVVWVLSHLRRPTTQTEKPILSWAALGTSYVPVGLTLFAALGMVMPVFGPLILKVFAMAVAFAAVSWCLSVVALVRGGSKSDLSRARKALILAGTPWYCLVLYLATYL